MRRNAAYTKTIPEVMLFVLRKHRFNAEDDLDSASAWSKYVFVRVILKTNDRDELIYFVDNESF